VRLERRSRAQTVRASSDAIELVRPHAFRRARVERAHVLEHARRNVCFV